MLKGAKKWANELLLSAMKSTPDRLAKHMLFLLRSHPDVTDGWGYHVRPMHYYEPLPDYRSFDKQKLRDARVPKAIDFGHDAQRDLLNRLSAASADEIGEMVSATSPQEFDFQNPYFAGLDAAIYYALIRMLRPATIVEIGSGYSTQIASKALSRNRADRDGGRLICIEPYPEARLRDSGAEFELIETPVQAVPVEVFDQLGTNDILLIDSSHIVAAQSDVCFEFLEILPRLQRGVWIHVHDIFFPTDYPEDWVLQKRRAFNEQYLLEAFLSFNETFTVRLANAWLWRDERVQAEGLLRISSSSTPPASFWMSKAK